MDVTARRRLQPVGESGPRASAVTVRKTIRPVTDETQNGTWHTLAALDHRPMRNQAQKPSSGTARLRTAVRPHWSLQRWTPVPVRPPDAAHDDARSRRRPVSRVPPPAAAPADPLASSGSNGWVGTNPHQRDLQWSSRTARPRWNLPVRDLGGSPTRDPAKFLLADRGDSAEIAIRDSAELLTGRGDSTEIRRGARACPGPR
jgi:hypothetical protein